MSSIHDTVLIAAVPLPVSLVPLLCHVVNPRTLFRCCTTDAKGGGDRSLRYGATDAGTRHSPAALSPLLSPLLPVTDALVMSVGSTVQQRGQSLGAAHSL